MADLRLWVSTMVFNARSRAGVDVARPTALAADIEDLVHRATADGVVDADEAAQARDALARIRPPSAMSRRLLESIRRPHRLPGPMAPMCYPHLQPACVDGRMPGSSWSRAAAAPARPHSEKPNTLPSEAPARAPTERRASFPARAPSALLEHALARRRSIPEERRSPALEHAAESLWERVANRFGNTDSPAANDKDLAFTAQQTAGEILAQPENADMTKPQQNELYDFLLDMAGSDELKDTVSPGRTPSNA